MVHLKSTLVFLVSIAAVGLATPVKRTVAQVNADIASISSKVTALDTAINSFPATGGTLLAALGIHTSAGTLITALQTGTTDVVATGPVDDTDGTTILTSVQAFELTIQDALVAIVTKRPAFVALPIGGIPALVLQDLIFLKGNTTAFANALITNAPASLTAPATTLRDDITTAFDTAITAYS